MTVPFVISQWKRAACRARNFTVLVTADALPPGLTGLEVPWRA